MENLKITSISKLKNIDLPGKSELQSYCFKNNNRAINLNYQDDVLNITYNKKLIEYLSGGSITEPKTWMGFIITFNQSNANVEYDQENSIGEWATSYSIEPGEKTEVAVFNDEVEIDNSIIVWINSTDNITMSFKNEDSYIQLPINFIDNTLNNINTKEDGFYIFKDEEWEELDTIISSDNIQTCNTYLYENDYTNKDAYKLALKTLKLCTTDKVIQTGDFLDSIDISYIGNKIYIDKDIDANQAISYIVNTVEDNSNIVIFKSFYRYTLYGIYTNNSIQTICSLIKDGEEYKIVSELIYRINGELIASKKITLFEHRNWIDDNCKIFGEDVIITFKKDDPDVVLYKDEEQYYEISILYPNGIITYTSETVLDDLFYIKPYITKDFEAGLYDNDNNLITYGTADIIDDLPYTNVEENTVYKVMNIADNTSLVINKISTVTNGNTEDEKLTFNNSHIEATQSSFSLTNNTSTISIKELKEIKYVENEDSTLKNQYVDILIDFGIYNRLIKIDDTQENLLKHCTISNNKEVLNNCTPSDPDVNLDTSLLIRIDLEECTGTSNVLALKKINAEDTPLIISFNVDVYSPTEDEEEIQNEKTILLHLIEEFKESLGDENAELKYYLLNGQYVYMYAKYSDSENYFYEYKGVLEYTPYALIEENIINTLNTTIEPVNINRDLSDPDIYKLMKKYEELNPEEKFGLQSEEDFIFRLKNIYCEPTDDIAYAINKNNTITLYLYIDKEEGIITYTYTIRPEIWNVTADRIAILLRKYNVRKVIIGKRINLFSNEIVNQYFKNSNQLYYKQLRDKIMLYEVVNDNVDYVNYESNLNLLLAIIPSEWDSNTEEMIEILNENGAIKLEDEVI